MTRVIHKSHDTRLARATADGDALWLDRDELERATGWRWKPQGLCRDETCMPIPRDTDRPLVDGDRLDAAGMWRYAGLPVAHNRSGDLWVLGEGASQRDRKSTRLNSSHLGISYAVFCLKKKNKTSQRCTKRKPHND